MSKPASGFTLIEIAVVLTIMGILMGSGLYAIGSVLDNMRINQTRATMDRVADALSLFIQQNYYVPCPASPDAAVATAGVARTNCTAYDVTSSGAIGIVPYRTLGLRPEDVQDGYSHSLTYVINPAYREAAVRSQSLIHDVCRQAATWINMDADEGSSTANIKRNRAPFKAVFCCPPFAGTSPSRAVSLDPIVNDEKRVRISPVRDTLGSYGYLDDAGPKLTETQTHINAIAFLLISHGRNSAGAFISGTTQRIEGPAAGRDNEIENQNNDNIFVEAPESTNRDSYFDDMLLWRTTDQAISSSGKDGCSRP